MWHWSPSSAWRAGAVMMAGLNERRREFAILRAVGAGPRQAAALLAPRRRAGHAAEEAWGVGIVFAVLGITLLFALASIAVRDWRCTWGPNLH